MQAAGIILVALVVYADAQPHPGRCPRLNTPPPEPTDDSCHWVVKVDFRGCRYYFEECWKPNMCTGKNEMLWICSSECPPTCAEKWPGCGEQCGSPCCQCVGGYVRDSRGVCIPIQDCPDENPPALCGPNERFVNCSSLCEPTCQSKPNQPCPYVCGPPKCECLPGYVRDQGKCILPKQCPSADPTCGPNEEFVTCSSACEPTCESPPNQPCILMCGPPKCQCRPGFVRHQGRCILRSQCPSADPKPTCDPNERFVECSSLCEPTCESPTGQPCVKKCGPPKCECLPGFVRDQGKCIPPDQCPSIGGS